MKTQNIVIIAALITLNIILTSCNLWLVDGDWSLGPIDTTVLEAKYTGKNTMELRYRAQEPDDNLHLHTNIRGKTQKYRIDRVKGINSSYAAWRYKITWVVEPNWIPGDTITVNTSLSGSVSFDVPVEK